MNGASLRARFEPCFRSGSRGVFAVANLRTTGCPKASRFHKAKETDVFIFIKEVPRQV